MNTQPPFTAPESFPSLGDREVHVWAIELGRISAALAAVLSLEERKQAARLRFEHGRERYEASHAALRCLLGRYAGLDPRALGFSLGSHGKPALLERPELQFNLAHSGELALLAVTRVAPVGIDVERPRQMKDLLEFARQNFAPEEQARLHSLPESARQEAFYQCWTRKEAVIKALGEGLAMPLASFAVAFGPREPPRLLRVDRGGERTQDWSLASLAPAPGYTGALALRAPACKLRCWSGQPMLWP